jgi:hypothetical protein
MKFMGTLGASHGWLNGRRMVDCLGLRRMEDVWGLFDGTLTTAAGMDAMSVGYWGQA